jgi:transposase
LGALRRDPLTGHLFVFFNRRGDQCRALWWNRSGYCIWGTRLEKGRFRLPWDGPSPVVHEMEAAELNLILEGLELRGATRRPRWNSTSVIDQSSVAAAR